MKNALNIAIIGGGLLGLSTADSLVHRGAKVTIFEKGKEIGVGASRYNSGMIHPSQAGPWISCNVNFPLIQKIVRFSENSRELLMKRRKMLGCRDLDRKNGTVQIFDNEKHWSDAAEYYGNIGINCSIYDGRWSFGKRALMFPNDESGNAHHYCQLLGDDLRDRGCDIRVNTPASLLFLDENLYLRAGGQSLKFDRIIVAAGAASIGLVAPLELELPIVPVTGHALVFAKPKQALPDIPVMHWESRSALTVFEDHVRFSGTIGKKAPQDLYGIWQEVAPDIVSMLGAPLLEWSAERPVSKLGEPIIGPTSIPSLWLNTGHGHMGWSLCAWSGELLARKMTED